MMSVGEKVSVICLESIKNEDQKKLIIDTIIRLGKEIIEITLDQVSEFAGNIIQLQGLNYKHWVMSDTAYNSFSKSDLEKLSREGEIIKIPVPTIQKYGGGGIRCMIAGIFLKKK